MQNMQNLMRQAQKMQKDMAAKQAELAATTFVGKSAQDLVTVQLTGDKKVTAVSVSPDLIDPEDPETLQDMILSAVNDGLAQVDTATEQKLGKLAQGLPF